jgi:hypothetical protein
LWFLAARLSQAAGAALVTTIRNFRKDGDPTKLAIISGALFLQTNPFFYLIEVHFFRSTGHPTGFCHIFYRSASLEVLFNLTGGKN